MHIAQVNYQDVLGGAERIALEIHRRLQQQGHNATLYVRNKTGIDETIQEINPDKDNAALTQFAINQALRLEAAKQSQLNHYASKLLRAAARPAAFMRWQRGEEEFNYVKTEKILNGDMPDILHLHNLHGGYFDLRLLPQFSNKLPVNITLHDEWMYTGHCGYSFACNRWQSGCGECPDLDSYPAIRVDNTRKNLQVKKAIYQHSRFYLTTPSQWLMQRVKRSVLADSIIDSKVINNGVDTTIFKQADRNLTRERIGIKKNVFVGLFIANHFQTSKAKDYSTVLNSMRTLADRNKDKDFVLIAIGESLGNNTYNNLEVKTLPLIQDQNMIAAYYQSADVYLHAARTEIWGLTITEAMACGIPVIATATGGIPEQVKQLTGYGVASNTGYSKEEATGILIEESKSEQMCQVMSMLLENKELAKQLGANAITHVSDNYSITSMVKNYMEWYALIIEQSKKMTHEPTIN